MSLDFELELSGDLSEDSQFLRNMIRQKLNGVSDYIERFRRKPDTKDLIEFRNYMRRAFAIADLYQMISEGTDLFYNAKTLYEKLMRTDVSVRQGFLRLQQENSGK